MDPDTAVDHEYLRSNKDGYSVVPTTAYIEGDTLYIIPDQPLDYDTSYSLELPYLGTDLIRGTNGLQVGGGRNAWNFRTRPEVVR